MGDRNATPGAAPRTRPGDDQPLRAHWDPTAADVGRAPMPRPERKTQSALGRFLHTYGWRAYAIPVLVVLTVLLIVATVRDSESPTPASQTTPGTGVRNTNVNAATTAIGAPTGGATATVLPAGQLPAGGPFTEVGRKSWRTIPGTTGVVGNASRVYTYTVEAENGLVPQDYGSDAIFAKLVDATLANPKSWTGDGKVAFRRIASGNPDFRISLTSTGTTRELCGYQIKLESSCYYPPEARVTLNEARWVRGAVAYQGDDLLYRQYQINHEVGHAIGYEQHEPCEAEGALAPVMMQQSFGVANSEIMALDPDMRADRDLVCRANPWPFPTR
ncbi:DUF3152 domain-containing protein [Williamsia maris]|uniref:DUF3152 domain-containing protein n=1 Tax=Williamsia maris TaxID=72806 RepID=UPI0020A281CF|nr:DUF3152 domain-containing protein [Williamsia maris]